MSLTNTIKVIVSETLNEQNKFLSTQEVKEKLTELGVKFNTKTVNNILSVLRKLHKANGLLHEVGESILTKKEIPILRAIHDKNEKLHDTVGSFLDKVDPNEDGKLG